MKEPRILLITNKYPMYRRPIFRKLADNLNVYFLFTDEKKIEDLSCKHEVMRKYGIRPFAFAFGLIPVLLFKPYDLVVFPPADSPGELFDNFVCFLANRIRGKPYLIWSERWRWKDDKKSFKRRFYLTVDEFVMGFIFRNASVCMTDGKKHREYLLSLNVSENKIVVIPPASEVEINSDNNSIDNIKNELGVGEKRVILYVGRLIKLKGANFLIEAFGRLRAEMDDLFLLIIGGGGLYGKTSEERLRVDELKELSEKLGLKLNRDISFCGDVMGKELARYFLACNVFVLPGITYVIAEAWGLVLNEAMQFGKPVISTDAVGAAYDLIEDGINGFMVPERNVDALYKALIRILSDQKLEEKMGIESKRIISRYSYDDMFDGFKKAFNCALKSNNK